MSQKTNNKTTKTKKTSHEIKDIKPTVKEMINLPDKIHGQNFKVVKVLFNKDGNNTHINIETFVNKLLVNLRSKNIKSFYRIKFRHNLALVRITRLILFQILMMIS